MARKRSLTLAHLTSHAGKDAMDKTLRRYTSLDEMKRDEYREWQKLTPLERLDAGAELSIGAYSFKHAHVPQRMERTLVRLQQPER